MATQTMSPAEKQAALVLDAILKDERSNTHLLGVLSLAVEDTDKKDALIGLIDALKQQLDAASRMLGLQHGSIPAACALTAATEYLRTTRLLQQAIGNAQEVTLMKPVGSLFQAFLAQANIHLTTVKDGD